MFDGMVMHNFARKYMTMLRYLQEVAHVLITKGFAARLLPT